jgi:chromosome segregation ATPase
MNFNNKQDRIKYLEDKFDNLMDVIGTNYGEPLMKELVSRLNSTIDSFNSEMSTLFNALKEKEKKREDYLNNIDKKSVKNKSNSNNLSEWEEKLEKLEQLK